MTILSHYLSITLNVYGLNSPIKRHTVEPGMVVCAYNPSYSVCGNKRIVTLGQPRQKVDSKSLSPKQGYGDTCLIPVTGEMEI
jgi:hypothetical protein